MSGVSDPDQARYAIDLNFETKSTAVKDTDEERGNCWYKLYFKDVSKIEVISGVRH